MKQPQYKRQDEALQSLTHRIDGELLPNPIRWTHPEKETLITGKMGYGDVTSWATGTTRAKRPEFNLTAHKPKPTPIHNMGELREAGSRMAKTQPAKVEVITACTVTKFDENEHAVKVAEKIQAIQGKLDKAFAKARKELADVQRVKVKRKVAPKPIGKIKSQPGYVMRVPEFLNREPKSEIGPCIERGIEKLPPYVKPSQGGRAGRVERWGE